MAGVRCTELDQRGHLCKNLRLEKSDKSIK